MTRQTISLILALPLVALVLTLPPAPAPASPLPFTNPETSTAPLPTPTPSGTVRVANLHHHVGPQCNGQHGKRCFLGQVINDTPYIVDIQPPRILLLDAYGHQIAVAFAQPFARTLLPGQRTPFIQPVSALLSFHSAAATVDWTPVVRFPLENTRLDSHSGYWRATGQVRNHLSVPLNALHLAAILYNSTGRIIAIGQLRTHQGWTLSPGQTWPFSIMVGEWVSDTALPPTQWEIIASPFYAGPP